jgi:hypothetical protein
MVTHPARALCVIYTTAIGRVRDRNRASRPVPFSKFWLCTGNVTSGDQAVQGIIALVTKEQSALAGSAVRTWPNGQR